MMKRYFLIAGFTLALASGCTFSSDDDAEQGATGESPAAQAAQPAPPPPPDLRIEVDLAARQLHVYRAEQLLETHPVAVGTPEWPTPTGQWTIDQVIFNPRWIPPEESWAEDEDVSEPGDPDNPLGRAQLVYRAPNSIHGTRDTASLGKAASHGSIRVSNDVAVRLAKLVMESGGAMRDSAWFARAQADSTQRQEVIVPNPVRIVVR
jgi:lipoprotein-anchoring transpeptidase ErfK/SrfK